MPSSHRTGLVANIVRSSFKLPSNFSRAPGYRKENRSELYGFISRELRRDRHESIVDTVHNTSTVTRMYVPSALDLALITDSYALGSRLRSSSSSRFCFQVDIGQPLPCRNLHAASRYVGGCVTAHISARACEAGGWWRLLATKAKTCESTNSALCKARFLCHVQPGHRVHQLHRRRTLG
jgi:hypothetical protein